MNDTIKIMQNFVTLWKKRNFSEEGGIAIGIIAGSKQAIDLFGNENNAFARLIDITEESQTEQEALDTFYALIEKSDS